MMMFAEPLYAFVAVAGFALLFHVPARLLLPAGLGGGLGWAVFLSLFQATNSTLFATFIAAAFVAAYGELLARLVKRPATLFSTCAIIPLVPGKGIFETMSAAVANSPVLALTNGLRTLALAGAIASGLALVAALLPRAKSNRRAAAQGPR